jgi:hypothetical protein
MAYVVRALSPCFVHTLSLHREFRILITFALIVVLIRGIKSSKNGDGLNSQLVV